MERAYRQGDPDQPTEHCHLCDRETGRAGPSDDSLYCTCGEGPFCDSCYEAHDGPCTKLAHATRRVEERDTRIAELEAALKNAKRNTYIRVRNMLSASIAALDREHPYQTDAEQNPDAGGEG